MSFNFQRHIRMAGSVVAIVGCLMHNLALGLLGWFIITIGYMVTIAKVEHHIEQQTAKEDADALHQ